MNHKIIRSLFYGLIFLVLSHDLMIAQETNTDKVPEDPKVKEASIFYWKSEVKDLIAEKEALKKKYADLQSKYDSDINALKAENERLKKYSDELTAEQKDQLKTRDEQSKANNDKIATLQKELDELKKQKEQVEKDLQSKTFAEKQAQDRILVLEKSISTVRSEKESIVTSNTSTSRSTDSANTSSNAELQAQVNSLTNQRDQLQRDLVATYSYIDSLKNNPSSSNVATTTTTSTENSKNTVGNSDSDAKIKSLEAKLAEVIAERDRLQKELALAKANNATNKVENPAKENVATTSTSEKTTNVSESKTEITTDKDKRIAELQAQVNSLTNQRDQLQRDIAAIYGYQKSITINKTASDPYTTVENNAPKKETTTVTPSTSKTVISSNASLEEALAKAKKLEADLAEMTKQRDKLQKELDTNYNNMYKSKTNPLSPVTNGTNSTSTTTTTTQTDVKTTNTPAKTQTDAKTTNTTPAKTETDVKTTTETTTEIITSEAAQKRIQQLEGELGILTKERDQLRRDLNASKADKVLEKQIADINAKIEKIEADTTLTQEEKEEQISEANAELEKIKGEKKKTEIAIENNTKTIETKSTDFEKMKKEYESKIESLTKEISDLKDDKETLETDLASTKEQMEEESSKSKEEIERLTLQAQKLEDALEQEIKKGNKSSKTTPLSEEDTQITSKGGKTIISLGSKVNFKSGSKELTAQGKRTLDKIIKVLQKHASDRIQIEGNADNKPFRGKKNRRDNWHLSFDRALTVLHYLNKGKLGKTQFAAVGFGDKNPVKPNTSAANRAANRRVDITVIPKR